MEMVNILITSGALALLVNIAATPLIMSISHRRKLYDHPNGRKIHTYPIPRLGGIGIFLSFLVSLIVVPTVIPAIFSSGIPFPFDARYLFILAGLVIVFIIGLIDDLRNLRAILKFILQVIAATLVVTGGFAIKAIRAPGIGSLDLGVLSYPVTVLWIVGVTNALNLVDGIDGFAGGIAGFAALSLGIISLLQGEPLIALLAFTLLGSVVAFLVFNFPPGKIFHG